MRFMILLKGNAASESGVLPTEAQLEAMAKYNEELVKAGVMLDGAGLHPTSNGVRVRFSGDERRVIDGPFSEAKEILAGYWMLQTKSKAEAIEWVKRCPSPFDGSEAEIEIRQVYELSDFPAGDAIDHHTRLQEQLGKA